MDLSSPSVSKLVDGSVKQELVNCQESTSDRRRLTLGLTDAGESMVNFARNNAQVSLAKTLSCLSDNELEIVGRAMELLCPLFGTQGKQPAATESIKPDQEWVSPNHL